eukprot:4001978-Alexandrium_andersonii.AAC.2
MQLFATSDGHRATTHQRCDQVHCYASSDSACFLLKLGLAELRQSAACSTQQSRQLAACPACHGPRWTHASCGVVAMPGRPHLAGPGPHHCTQRSGGPHGSRTLTTIKT